MPSPLVGVSEVDATPFCVVDVSLPSVVVSVIASFAVCSVNSKVVVA